MPETKTAKSKKVVNKSASVAKTKKVKIPLGNKYTTSTAKMFLDGCMAATASQLVSFFKMATTQNRTWGGKLFFSRKCSLLPKEKTLEFILKIFKAIADTSANGFEAKTKVGFVYDAKVDKNGKCIGGYLFGYATCFDGVLPKSGRGDGDEVTFN